MILRKRKELSQPSKRRTVHLVHRTTKHSISQEVEEGDKLVAEVIHGEEKY